MGETDKENERFRGEVKAKKLQGELMEIRAEFADVLRKLSPLL